MNLGLDVNVSGSIPLGGIEGTVWTPSELASMRAYLEARAGGESQTEGLRQAGTHGKALKHWRDDPDFADAEEAALQAFADSLEYGMLKRVREGTRRKLYTTKGEAIIDPETGEHATEVSHDTLLTMFALKRWRPEYRDRQAVVQAGGDSITIQFDFGSERPVLPGPDGRLRLEDLVQPEALPEPDSDS